MFIIVAKNAKTQNYEVLGKEPELREAEAWCNNFIAAGGRKKKGKGFINYDLIFAFQLQTVPFMKGILQ